MAGTEIYTTATIAYFPFEMVRLACRHCDRRGQYRKATLVARYGAESTMPDVLHKIAQCRRYLDMSHPCGVYYADLARGDWGPL